MTDIEKLAWRASPPMKNGDTFTIQGHYKRRSFWQWLTRQPRQLQLFKIVAESAGVELGII